mmetsp:Transcript_1403/g.3232  ORF Transcript_1403/g.3232 Transcript_1403/m.3232 type:complete len:183 (-) Transcript_1403:46-594(-)
MPIPSTSWYPLVSFLVPLENTRKQCGRTSTESKSEWTSREADTGNSCGPLQRHICCRNSIWQRRKTTRALPVGRCNAHSKTFQRDRDFWGTSSFGAFSSTISSNAFLVSEQRQQRIWILGASVLFDREFTPRIGISSKFSEGVVDGTLFCLHLPASELSRVFEYGKKRVVVDDVFLIVLPTR